MSDKVPIRFEHEGKLFEGYFSMSTGAGESYVWHLMIDRKYWGRLRYTDRWMFDGRDFKDIEDFFGDYVTRWYGSK